MVLGLSTGRAYNRYAEETEDETGNLVVDYDYWKYGGNKWISGLANSAYPGDMLMENDLLEEDYPAPFYNSIESYEEQEMTNESNIEQIQKDIEDIKINHLTSIKRRLGRIEARVWYILGALAVLVPLAIAILTIVVFK